MARRISRVVEFRDSIKGEALRLLLIHKDVEYISHRIDCDICPKAANVAELATSKGLYKLFEYLPELHENSVVIHGLSDCMLSLSYQYAVVPSDPEHFYKSLRIVQQVDLIQTLASLYLYLKPSQMKRVILKEVAQTMQHFVSDVETLMEFKGEFIFGCDYTMADFAVLGLYCSTYHYKALNEVVNVPMERATVLQSYLTQRLPHFFPGFVKRGIHVTFHAEEPFATIYALLNALFRVV